MAGRRIVVEFLGKDTSLGKTSKDVESKTVRMGDRMSKVGKVAGVALAGGFLAAGAAAIKMSKGAAEDEAAASKLAQTLRTAAGATKGQIAQTEDWITAQGKATGITDDELRPALGRLAASTHDVGKAQKLTSLAMDISAGSGKSLQQVTEALQKGVNGSVGGLSRLGVATKDAHGRTKSLDDITKDLANTYKGAAAKAADTTAGKQKILSTQFGELQETIGYKLLPVMSKLADIGIKTVDWMTKNWAVIKPLAIAVGALAGGLLVLVKVTQAFTAVQAALDVVLAANPIGLVVVAIAALVAGLVIAYKKSETFRNIVNGAFNAVGKACFAMWDKFIRPVLKLWVNQWFLVVGALVNGAAKAFGWVPGIGPKLKKAADWFNDFKQKVNNQIDGMHDPKIKVTTPGADDAIGRLKTLNNLLNVIHNKKQVKVNVATPGMFNPGHNAAGTNNWRGGPTWVGERGPELLDLPSGSRITPNNKAMAGRTVTHVLDLRLNGKTIRKMLLDEQRSVGYSFGIS